MSKLITGQCYGCRFAEEDRCDTFTDLMNLSGGEMTVTISGCLRFRRPQSIVTHASRTEEGKQ